MNSPKHYIALFVTLAVLAIAIYFAFHIIPLAVGALIVLALALVFVPAARNKFFSVLGISPPTSLADLLSDLNGLVANLEKKANDLLDEAEGHKQIAAEATSNAAIADAQAAHATKVARNVKTLIAP